MKSFLFAIIFLFTFKVTAYAAQVVCKIAIEDFATGVKYNIEHKPFPRGDLKSDKFEFDVPGADYSCYLTFFGLGNGSALACEYDKDMGYTFFKSDRSLLEENPVKNNLSFRHEGSFVIIKTICSDG